MSPTPIQLLRPPFLAATGFASADTRPISHRVVETKRRRDWLRQIRLARFGVYHSLEAH